MIHFIEINLRNLINEYLPIIFKTLKFELNNIFQWLYSLVKPIETVANSFYNFRDATVYEVGHNAQVYSLEHYLNDYFNLPFPPIYTESIIIANMNYTDRYYLMKDSNAFDNEQINDEPYYLYSKTETTEDTNDVEMVITNGNTSNIEGSYIKDFDINNLKYYYYKDGNPTIRIEKEINSWITNNEIQGKGKRPEYVKVWYDTITNNIAPYQSKAKNKLYLKEDYMNETGFIIYCPHYLITNTLFEETVYGIVNRYRAAGFTATIKYY